MIDAEEIAFSNYLLPKITLIDSDEAPGLVLTQNIEFEEEVPEGTEILLEVSGKKLSANIPNIPPCFYSSDEAESLIKAIKNPKKNKNNIKDPNILNLEKTLEDKIGINVNIKNSKNNTGQLTFNYKDPDQLNRLINIIKSYY